MCIVPPYLRSVGSAATNCYPLELHDPCSCNAGLPTDAQQSDVQKLFEGYGPIIECRVMTGLSTVLRDRPFVSFFDDSAAPIGFGFIEFESPKVCMFTE